MNFSPIKITLRILSVTLGIVVLVAACTGCGNRSKAPSECLQIDSFDYYSIDKYCPPPLHLGLEGPHGSYIRINWEFPTACSNKVVLDSIQRDICKDLEDAYRWACYDTLHGGLCLDTCLYVLQKSDTLVPLTFSFEESMDWIETNGYYNDWIASILRTLYNKNGVYCAKHQYDVFESGAFHNWFGTRYFTYRLSDGHRMYLQDILTKEQLHRLTDYLVDKYEVNNVCYRYGLDPDSVFIPFGICDTKLVLHFNAGVLNSWADGEREEVLLCDGERLNAAIVSGQIDTAYMDSVLTCLEFGRY